MRQLARIQSRRRSDNLLASLVLYPFIGIPIAVYSGFLFLIVLSSEFGFLLPIALALLASILGTLLLGAPLGLLVHRLSPAFLSRRIPCSSCGYDLRGLDSTCCPECGQEKTPTD